MNNIYNELYCVMVLNSYNDNELKDILKKLNKLLFREPSVMLKREDILRELKNTLRAISEKENQVRIFVIEYLMKLMLKDDVFTENDIKKILNTYNMPNLYALSYVLSNENNMQEVTKLNTNKIFISHSEKDVEYVNALVEFLEDIRVEEDKIFCSSVSPYNIPFNNNIYDYIRNEFLKTKPYVIFILSKNYYKSAACLNEMGAAWIMRSGYISLLLPDFDFNDIRGAIDATKIGIKLYGDNKKLRDSLISFRKLLENNMIIDTIDEHIWNRKLDKFISKISILNTKAVSSSII